MYYTVTIKRTRILYFEIGELPNLYTRCFYIKKFDYLFTKKVGEARDGARQHFEGAVTPSPP